MTSDNKTQPHQYSLGAFLDTLDAKRRQESDILITLMQEVSGEPAVLWGPSIIGFGTYHYKYASGREGDMIKIGFSPRKGMYSLYLSANLKDIADDLQALGKTTQGKGCVYFRSLQDIDSNALKKLLKKVYRMNPSFAI